MTKTNKGRWYFRQDEEIHGPFPNKLIGRYLILGRITLETPVSQDRNHWAEVSQYPALVPDVVKEAGTPEGDRALMLARIREDERSSRSSGKSEFDERREDEEPVVQLHRQIRDDVLNSPYSQPRKRLIYGSVIVLFLATFIAVYMTDERDSGARLTDCMATAEPGINWSGCNKPGAQLRNASLQSANLRNARLQQADLSSAQLQQADLAYADLSQAILLSAQLQQADLKGANLYQANLQGANLKGANLSHAELLETLLIGAELDGARFDHAIWINGEKCLPGSVGGCLQAVQE